MADINIYGVLKNATPENVIAVASLIKDETMNKTQEAINKLFLNGENLKTINNTNLAGEGNIKLVGVGIQDFTENEELLIKSNLNINDKGLALEYKKINSSGSATSSSSGSILLDTVLPANVKFLILDLAYSETSTAPSSPNLSIIMSPNSNFTKWEGGIAIDKSIFKALATSDTILDSNDVSVDVTTTATTCNFTLLGIRYSTSSGAGFFKGHFNTKGELTTAHPTSDKGAYAYVGNPRHLYTYNTSWVDNGVLLSEVENLLGTRLDIGISLDLATKLTTEYNVSLMHPKEGPNGDNKYTLETAILKIPAELRTVGIKCSFLDNAGETVTFLCINNIFDNLKSWIDVSDRKISANIDKIVGSYKPFINELDGKYFTGDVGESISEVINSDSKHAKYDLSEYAGGQITVELKGSGGGYTRTIAIVVDDVIVEQKKESELLDKPYIFAIPFRASLYESHHNSLDIYVTISSGNSLVQLKDKSEKHSLELTTLSKDVALLKSLKSINDDLSGTVELEVKHLLNEGYIYGGELGSTMPQLPFKKMFFSGYRGKTNYKGQVLFGCVHIYPCLDNVWQNSKIITPTDFIDYNIVGPFNDFNKSATYVFSKYTSLCIDVNDTQKTIAKITCSINKKGESAIYINVTHGDENVTFTIGFSNTDRYRTYRLYKGNVSVLMTIDVAGLLEHFLNNFLSTSDSYVEVKNIQYVNQSQRTINGSDLIDSSVDMVKLTPEVRNAIQNSSGGNAISPSDTALGYKIISSPTEVTREILATWANCIVEIKAPITFPVSEKVYFPTGKVILYFNGGSMTFNKHDLRPGNAYIIARPYQIFFGEISDYGVSDDRLFEAEVVYPEWFGAKGNGVSDDSDAFNKMSKYVSAKCIELTTNSTYILDSTALVNKSIIGNGAKIKRCSTWIDIPLIANPVDSSEFLSITLDERNQDLSKLKVGMSVALVNSGGDITSFDKQRIISAIKGNIVELKSFYDQDQNLSWSNGKPSSISLINSFILMEVKGDCEILDVDFDGGRNIVKRAPWQKAVMLSINSSNNASVRQCRMNNAVGDALEVFGKNVDISHNFFYHCGSNAVHLSGINGATIHHNCMVDTNINQAIGHNEGCITFSNQVYNTIIDSNIFDTCRNGIGSIDSADNCKVHITNNIFKNYRENGIQGVCTAVNGNVFMDFQILGNRFVGSADDMSSLEKQYQYATIGDKKSSTGYGVYLKESSGGSWQNVIVASNIFRDSGVYIGNCVLGSINANTFAYAHQYKEEHATDVIHIVNSNINISSNSASVSGTSVNSVINAVSGKVIVADNLYKSSVTFIQGSVDSANNIQIV